MPEIQDTSFLNHLKSEFSSQTTAAHFEEIYNYFPSLIYVIDLEKKKVNYINKNRCSKMLGLTTDDLAGFDDLSKLVFEEDRDVVNRELRTFELLADSDEHSFQCRLNSKPGEYRYFRSQGIVLRRNEQGIPISLLFTSEDITDSIKPQEELLALKQLIDETENLLNSGSWSLDIPSRILQCTDGIYKLLGYEKSETRISLPFYLQHIHKKDAAAVEDGLEKGIETKTDFRHTYTIVTKQGQEKLVNSKGKVVINATGEVTRVLGTTRDITKEARVNNDLLRYKEMIVEKEEFLNQGSWEWNIKENTRNWSEGMCRLFGCDSAGEMNELIGDDQLYPLPPESETLDADEWNELLKEKESYTFEKTITTKDGQKKQLETYGKILRDQHNRPEKIIGTSRDVTPLRRYEKSLEEKIQELNRSNKELEEFAYVASHDLQEPLRKLTTFGERLTTKFSSLLGSEGKVYLERMGAATDNMRVLIENLLEFSRTARSTNRFTSENLSAILESVKADLELSIEETGTEIIADELPVVEVISSQISQLFDNLLNNAMKFRKKNEHPVIRITCSQLTIEEKDALHLPVDKNYYKIAFQDNGIGFEQQYAERIFQIFQRLHGKAEFPGSGIGLAICKKIVDNHGGIINAEGKPEEGARFTIILPEKQMKKSNEFT